MTEPQSDWAERVLAGAPRVAVFDCDGTLWSGDAGFSFMRWSLAQGLVSAQRSAALLARYAEYQAGSVSEATMCGEMVQVYAGLDVSRLRKAAAAFFREEIEPGIFTELDGLVRTLRARGAEIWAVSSTCDWVVEAGVVERFGIPAERVLAACARSQNGRATDELVAVPTDEAKADALRSVGVPRPDAVFGNSIHDLAMLELARDPYPVNPSEALRAHAEASGWPVFWPAGLQMRPPERAAASFAERKLTPPQQI